MTDKEPSGHKAKTAAAAPAGGGRRLSLFWKLLGAFVVLAVLPLAGSGALVAIEVDDLRQQAERTSRTYERRAERIAGKVADFLHGCERDLRRLAAMPRETESYVRFASSRKRRVWIRAGTDTDRREERVDALLYKELSFIAPDGREQVLVVRGRPVPEHLHRDVSDPANTTYRSETYFLEAMKLRPGAIHVSHLNGFHLTKIEQLDVEGIIARLPNKSQEEKRIYRYLLYTIMRAAGVVEYVDAFTEKSRTIQVYRVPGEDTRILVDVPVGTTPEEIEARELELEDLINRLAPEDTVEGERYDGVIRFSMPVAGPGGEKEGVVSIALDHLHLMQFTQHVKAMELGATVFAGYRDADYTYLFDDQGWIITHPKFWNIRGVDHTGQPVPPFTEKSTPSQKLVGRTPVNLTRLDWKMGKGYHALVLETRAGRTGIATSNNLGGVLRTRVYSPVFYDTGPYARHGIFGGVMLGTSVNKFILLMRKISSQISERSAQVHGIIVWVLAVVLVLVVVLSVVMARGLVRPLRALTRAAQRIGGGDLDAAVPAGGGDEIGLLADTFRDMTGSLKDTIGQLERRNLELKQAQQKLLQAEREKRRKLQREVENLQKEVARSSFASMVAASPQMKKIQEEVVRISRSSATVLLLGENGTGKELVAEAIHKNSSRRDKQLVRINCAAFNENLLESELFGHTKGSYTGATSSRKGLFEAADGGTLLLDEIGDMSLEMQKKLLRTLQEGEVVPLGSNRVVKVDVRIIGATNKDLQQLMRDGKFREDLFHRINVISIRIPPLRERKDDILPLARFFLKKVCDKENKGELSIEPEAEGFLVEYTWPGNVRELENAIERAVIRSRGPVLHAEDFQLAMEDRDLPCVADGIEEQKTLEEVEKAYILAVLDKNGGNKKETARQLGIGYNTLWRKLKKYNQGQ